MRERKLHLLMLMMISRWIVNGFANVALIVILRDAGATLYQLSFMLAIGILDLFKFLWAPLVDRMKSPGSHFRSWFLVAQIAMIVPLACTAPLHPAQNYYFVYALLLSASFAATFRDIAMDGLIVKLLSQEERAAASGYLSACMMIGTIVGGGLILLLYNMLGWAGSIGLLVAALLLPLPFVWFFKEPMHAAVKASESVLPMLAHFFKNPGYRWWAVLLLLLGMIGTIENSLLSVMMIDYKWPVEKVGLINNMIAPGIAVLISVFIGQLFTHINRKSALIFACCCTAVTGAMIFWLTKGINITGDAYAVFVVILAAQSSLIVNTAIRIACIDRCAVAPNHAATYYTIQASLGQFGAIGLSALAPILAEQFGYSGALTVSIAIALLGAVAVSRFRYH
jgi:MFS transporter, PAT family, beta-lactamase induction signal transducer AmpG